MSQTDDLKAMISAMPGKTLAAKLRAVMPEIDKRVREGVRHDELIEMLNIHGFDLKLNTFRKYLYRYRKKLAEEQQQPARPIPAPASPTAIKSRPDGKPADSPIPTITNRGDLAKVRTADFDLDQLAEIGKTKE